VASVGKGGSVAVDGPTNSAGFANPSTITFCDDGNAYVGDQYLVRRVAPDRTTTTIAGAGPRVVAKDVDGDGCSATFLGPIVGVAYRQQKLYVAENSGVIRVVILP
jgi:hypothetical protein